MFDSQFFIANRQKLAMQLPNAVIFIAAHSQLQYSADVAYPFRQDSNFWYLTGLNTPDAVMVIDTSATTTTLLMPTQNDYQKEWDGTMQTDQLRTMSGITQFGTTSDIQKIVRTAIKQKRRICYMAPAATIVEPYGFYSNPSRKTLENELRKYTKQIEDIRPVIARLRMVKQQCELEAIQSAINVTANALSEVKTVLPSLKNEKDIERLLSARFHENADGHSFKPIVASGAHAAVIHYEQNNAPLSEDGLVLLDVGASFQGYAADISRVWSYAKKPSSRQVDVWNACLAIQHKAFSLLKPGVYLKEYQQEVEKEVQKQCKTLNCSMVGKKYPHGFSHFMGLDVHDAGDYTMALEENIVLTVEPGIYLPDEGIGVRVEDDVIITKHGIRILSKHIPQIL